MQVNHQADSKALKAITRTTGGGRKFKNGSKPTVATILVDIRGAHKIPPEEMKRAWLDVSLPKTATTLNKGGFDEK